MPSTPSCCTAYRPSGRKAACHPTPQSQSWLLFSWRVRTPAVALMCAACDSVLAGDWTRTCGLVLVHALVVGNHAALSASIPEVHIPWLSWCKLFCSFVPV